MRQKKLMKCAQKAQEKGYKYVASVVKSYYATTYYHVVSLNDVISAGKWIPAEKGSFQGRKNSSWYGRVGQKSLPEKTILRQKMFQL